MKNLLLYLINHLPILVLNYELPLNEVVFDFNDRLKSMTSGYASFDYEIIGHREGDLTKLGILVNGEPLDALAMKVHKDFLVVGRWYEARNRWTN